MILSQRKRALSPDLDNENESGMTSTRRLIKGKQTGPAVVEDGECPSSSAVCSSPNNHNAQHRKNKSFSSFLQNLFQGSSTSRNETSAGNSLDTEVKGKSQAPSGDTAKDSKDAQPKSTAQVQAQPLNSEQRRNSCTSFTNDAYSSSSESINTVLSTNSFSFVHPKKYRGKKLRGKRIPIDDNIKDKKLEQTPVKQIAQNAQPLPNRRKRLGTLSRLGMKIGLKSKYNLQSCESLASFRNSNINLGGAKGTGTRSGDINNSGSRVRSNKRRAPLPPSRAKAAVQGSSSVRFQNSSAGPSSTQAVQLKSVTLLGSNEQLTDANVPKMAAAPNAIGRPLNGHGHASQAAFSQDHRRCFSEGDSSAASSSSKVYFHVRGKRRAPVPPKLVSLSVNPELRISRESYSQVQSTCSTKMSSPKTPNLMFTCTTNNSNASCQPLSKPETTKSSASAMPPNEELNANAMRFSMVSEDEEIVQNILNAKQEEDDDVLRSPKPGTSGSNKTNIRQVGNNSISSSVSYFTSSTTPIKATSSSLLKNKQPELLREQVNQQLQNQHQSSQMVHTVSVASTSALLQVPDKKAKKKKKGPIVTKLGCYEEFHENEYENDDDVEDKSSTNSLLVHEAKLNEQVKAQLTTSQGVAGNSSKDGHSHKMYSLFSFKSKKHQQSTKTKGHYANPIELFNKNCNSSCVVEPESSIFNYKPVSPSFATTPIRSEEPTSPAKMTPRPWYKRSNSKDKTPNPGPSIRGYSATNKNRPSITILTKISELDREAAKIVEEKRRRSAIEQQNLSETAIEPISMFNTFNLTQQSIINPNSAKDSQNPSAKPTSSVVSSSKQSPTILPVSVNSNSTRNTSTSTAIRDNGNTHEEPKKLAIVQPQSFKNPSSTVTVEPSRNLVVGPISPMTPRSIQSAIVSVPASNSQSTEDWSCPRCTLKNVHWRSFCDACHFKQGSTIVQSMTSMFENATPNLTSSETAADATNKPSSNGSHESSSGIVPQCTQGQMSKINQEKDKKEKRQISIGAKLTEDPEVEELDIKKLREARLAFFRRHKVTVDDIVKSEANEPISCGSCNVKPQPKPSSTISNVSISGPASSNSNNSKRLNSTTSSPSPFVKISSPSRSTFTDDIKNNLNIEKEKNEQADLDKVIELHQELNPNISSSGPKAWKPLYPTKFPSILESIGESSACVSNKRPVQNNNTSSTSSSNTDKTKTTTKVPPSKYRENLDPTYENWHLKLSAIEQENISQQSTHTFIKNISTEIKDHIDYFDRLKWELKQQRVADCDEDCTSESDTSTLVYEPINMAFRQSRGDYYLQSVENKQRDHTSRRRISLGEVADTDFNYEGRYSESGDFPVRRRSSLENGHSFGESTGSRSRNHDDEFERRRKQQSRELEHSSSSISKQLRKLEWAINVGDHKLAAILAHDLAVMKATCNLQKLTLQETEARKPISIRVYVEDRVMQQGPFQVPVTSSTTVKELKVKIESDWGIPVPFQKWILGKKIAEDDGQTLISFGVADDSMAFLYLVSPAAATTNGERKQQSTDASIVQLALKTNSASATASTLSKPINSEPPPTSANASKIVTSPTATRKSEHLPIATNSKPVNQLSFPKSALKLEVEKDAVQKKFAIQKREDKFENVCVVTSFGLVPNGKSPVTPAKLIIEQPFSGSPTVHSSTHTKNINVPSNTASENEQKHCQRSEVSLTGVGLPKSSKHVTSKYIESLVTQTNNDAPSLPNLIFKEKVNNSIAENVINKQQTNTDFKITKSKTTEGKQSSAISPKQNPKVKVSTSSNTNHKGPLSLQDPSLNLIETKSKPTELNNTTSQPQRLPESEALLKVIESKQRNNGSRKVPDQTDMDPTDDAKSAVPKTNINIPNVERLLETRSELQNRQDKTSGPNLAQNSSPEKASQCISTSQQSQFTRSMLAGTTNVSNKSVEVKALGKGKGVANNSPNNSVNVSNATEGNKTKRMPVVSIALTVGHVPTTVENVCKLPSTQSENPHAMTPKDGQQVCSLKEPVKQQNESQLPTALCKLPTNKKEQDSEAGKTGICCAGSNSPQPSNSKQSKSVNVDLKTRWGLPQITEEPSKNEQKSRSLLSRKDSDAPDINLQAEFPESSEATIIKTEQKSNNNAKQTSNQPSEKKEDNNETYRRMLQLMENEDCVRNTEELECPICFTQIEVGNGVTLRDCLHNFCRECLAATIQYSEEPQVKCPFRDNNYSCESHLQEREIKGLVSLTIYEKHLAQSIKLAENKIANTFHCKTNDCTGWCIYEDDVNLFKCPVCKRNNCLTCQAIHEGKDCQQYQRELAIAAETDEGAKSSRLMLEKMIQRGEALECPACHVVLLKKWGCDWVRCSYCKTEICWITKGFRWGPNGKGDTSGGCKCGVNGVKCHAKCTYCH